MKTLCRIWFWLYPKPPMIVDVTAIDYYHRTVERTQHWAVRTDLKLKDWPYAPCK